MKERGIHDMGGLPAGAIDRHEHTPTMTERRIDAMMLLLRDEKRHLFVTDEHRRVMEELSPRDYEEDGYYARWVRAMRALLVEKGVLTEAEIEARVAAVKARLKEGASP